MCVLCVRVCVCVSVCVSVCCVCVCVCVVGWIGGQTTDFLNFAAGDACNSLGFKTIKKKFEVFLRIFCSAGSAKIT